MRVFKILLIIFSIIIVGVVVYIVGFQFTKENFSRIPYYVHIHLVLAFLFSVTNILYHIKSFRFYRRKEKRRLEKKVHKLLWVGTICCSTFLIYIGAGILYSMIISISYGFSVNTQDLYSIFIFFIPGFLGFLETSLLRKRIRRLRVESDVYEEIDTIGTEI
ncbi:hypothetical protein [Kordia sp.]|uniref:hypothetical protein n=1 Tax=Kordia sp. TaxID=1965332 RepID=UPI003D6B91CA